MTDMRRERLEVLVTVVASADSAILNRFRVNFLDPKGRQKIAKTAWWAMHNGHRLLTEPVGDR